MNADEIKAAARAAYCAAAEEMDGWPYDGERDVFEDGFERGFAAAPVAGQAEPSDDYQRTFHQNEVGDEHDGPAVECDTCTPPLAHKRPARTIGDCPACAAAVSGEQA